ncbi:DUF2231 domain-containing protein [Amycolatopsis sp. H20-H5]|uniref:DUF2231 domain-containing protein n=1 Tax=Amycolatopsis sp. H20-H5 TaxID=3046309 RepID=UPI002DB7452B|nr:DUF2231 domain-containing protein [Amycolatopsis sp. H20-H5]MEC3976199.1 DUF2231 domain-containing protein [Amycolatopsis sp. H20-H5]
MPVFLTGLPVHVLIVHAVVVLVPLAVVGATIVAVWPAARRRYGWLTVGLTALAAACVPIATGSGEDLRDRLVPTDLIRTHAQLGDELLVFVLALLILLAALVTVDHRRGRNAAKAALEQAEPTRGPRAIVLGLALLTVGFAVTSGVQVVRIGDSGARAAWAETHYVAPAPHKGQG